MYPGEVEPGSIGASGTGGARRRARLRLLLGVAVPVLAYLALDRVLHNGLLSLSIVELVPVLWALVLRLRQGRLDPLILATLLVLSAAVVISILDGGSTAPIKLRKAVVTGTLGLACLFSVLGGRPLLPLAIDMVERAWPDSARLAALARTMSAGRNAAAFTTILGVALLLDSLAQLTLALSVSTAVFLIAGPIARTCILASGLGACWWYGRHAPASPRAPTGC